MKPGAEIPYFKNPDLEGKPFFWEAGPIGILLCHGFTATTAEVRLLAIRLHEEGYTVAAPLLPGHYSHPEDLNAVRWQDWVSAVEQTYARLQEVCTQVFVGGESTGGILALYLAAEHPEAAGVLAYAPALRLNLSFWDTVLVYLLAPFKSYAVKDAKEDNLPWQGYMVNPLKGVIELFRLQKEVRRRLRGVRQPVLIVQGRQDATVHTSVPETIASRVSSSSKEVHWMEHSGHIVILDRQWQQVAEITLTFLQRVSAA